MMHWKKSSYSGSETECVEVAVTEHGVFVRDTKNREGGTQQYTAAEWTVFIKGVKGGDFDL